MNAMKMMMMSIRPQWVAKILNGEKTIEIRKRFPSDYVGWVYVYCTKDKKQCLVKNNINKTYHLDTCYWDEFESNLNGKVVARFWCDKVEPTYKFYVEELCQLACITKEELYKYAGGWHKTDDLLAIHITKLEIFDKPKEIYEMKRLKHFGIRNKCEMLVPLTSAPESYCYIEV